MNLTDEAEAPENDCEDTNALRCASKELFSQASALLLKDIKDKPGLTALLKRYSGEDIFFLTLLTFYVLFDFFLCFFFS